MGSMLTPEYIAVLRRMSGEEKLRAAFRLYWSARKIKEAAVRDQHPELTAEQVRERVREIFLNARN